MRNFLVMVNIMHYADFGTWKNPLKLYTAMLNRVAQGTSMETNAG